jgi:hypothetical protein
MKKQIPEPPNLNELVGHQIAHLSHRNVYEWVKHGKWSRPQFDKWVEELMVQSYGEGFEEAIAEEDLSDINYQ